MIRFAESAMQVMHRAGDHQVADARKALGHAYGGGSQYFLDVGRRLRTSHHVSSSTHADQEEAEDEVHPSGLP